jgi:lysophospholipase L1-like esterase
MDPHLYAMAMRAKCLVPALVVVALTGWAAEKEPTPLFQGEVGLILPPVINAVPGVEMNVYFDNVSLTVNPANYVFDVTCNRGAQQVERWTYTPSDKDVGQFGFTLEMRDQSNAVIARAQSMIRVAPRDAGDGKPRSILIFGDSLTAASVYSQRVLDLSREDENVALKLIGTRGPKGEPNGNLHEGYGGWTAERFATKYTGVARGGPYKECGSPFIYKDGDADPELDFARYCREFNDGKAPDFVTILLGCNDTFSATDDTIEERIDRMFRHYETLLKMIRDNGPGTQIGCLLLVPPAATQDAFGANYRSGQTRWQYKRNQHRVVERMLETFGGREAENIFLVPANVNLDCANNYPKRTSPANAHADVETARLNNGVHPAASGYRQIGDSVYCWIKSRLAASGSKAKP